MQPESELKNAALGWAENAGGRGKKKGGEGEKAVHTLSLGVKKSHLSDIARVASINGRWNWTDFDHTIGTGNFCLAEECDIMRLKVHAWCGGSSHIRWFTVLVCAQVRNFNIAQGISRAITASLEVEDIVESKHKSYKAMLADVEELRVAEKKREEVIKVSNEKGDPTEPPPSRDRAPLDRFVAKFTLAVMVYADLEISRWIVFLWICVNPPL
jgi:hypothetical protein